MIDGVEIREALPSDAPAIETLYPSTFPEEDLLPLVRDLQCSLAISLLGFVDSTLVGHAFFTPCSIAGSPDKVALLGPVAVTPSAQRQGIGGAIIRAGLQHLKDAGTARVYVLGDPAYYNRFGFEPDRNVKPPYSLPYAWRGAWQSLGLSDDKSPLHGTLCVPQPWRRQALWTTLGHCRDT
jgi:putative acetyltransferase